MTRRIVAALALAGVLALAVPLAGFTSGATPTSAVGPAVEITTAEGLGSGFYIGNGRIVTARHVVTFEHDGPVTGKGKNAKPAWKAGDIVPDIKVIVERNGEPGETIDAKVEWVDSRQDVAVIDLASTPTDLQAATVATQDAAIGTPVEVDGNPFGITFIHSYGHVAGVVRGIDDDNGPDFEQPFDAHIAPGNSGGPVYRAGTTEVVGFVDIFAGPVLGAMSPMGSIVPFSQTGSVPMMIAGSEISKLLDEHHDVVTPQPSLMSKVLAAI